jgi:hypothetical protein
MELQNSSKIIDISLYYKTIDENIFKEQAFVELINMLVKKELIYKYKYAFYTDAYLLKTNIYIPNFHTMYLANGSHNVVIKNSEDLWLLEIFNNNRYYVLDDPNDTFDYESHGIIKLRQLKDIGIE